MTATEFELDGRRYGMLDEYLASEVLFTGWFDCYREDEIGGEAVLVQPVTYEGVRYLAVYDAPDEGTEDIEDWMDGHVIGVYEEVA